MEWIKISFADQEDWEVQYDIVDGSEKIGSLVYSTEYGWQAIIGGTVECLYDAKTEEEAKRGFTEKLEELLERPAHDDNRDL